MAVVVVGGNSRNIGKTSVVAGLIHSLVEMEWSAFKVTQHGHLLCDGKSKRCDCTNAAHTVAFTAETNRTSGKDSARYLLAGAVRSFLLRTRQGSLAEAMPRLRAECAASRNAIIESNSVMEFLHPHLYLVVLDLATADFKTSAMLHLDRADAIVLRNAGSVRRKGEGFIDMEGLMESKLKFQAGSPELVSFVRERLTETVGHPMQSSIAWA